MTEKILGVNPKTGRPTGQWVLASSPADVAQACQRAAQAARHVSAFSLRERAAWLGAIAETLEDRRDELVEAAAEETALPGERLRGEITRTAYQLRLFAEVVTEGSFLEIVIDHAADTPMGPRPDLRRMLVPTGPVGVFGASNFPFAFSVLGGDTASALAAGCPVVVKGHPSHPHTSALSFAVGSEALRGAGAPEGMLQIVHGTDAGARLVQDPHITAVGFTGSSAGGQALAALAAQRPHPIPFYGELSGINPLVVMPGAFASNPEAIALGLAGSVTLGSGQFCTKPGLVLVPQEGADRFLAALAGALGSKPPMPALNAGIAAAYHGRARLLEGCPGATRLGTTRSPDSGDGYWMDPAVLVAELSGLGDQLLEECFGPLVIVSTYADQDQLLAALRRVPGSLAGSVHATDADDVEAVTATLAERTGRIVWNGYPTGVAVSWAMQHGGPAPATTNALFTSVGATATRRFMRPITLQDWPAHRLPRELVDDASTLPRRVDGVLQGPARA